MVSCLAVETGEPEQFVLDVLALALPHHPGAKHDGEEFRYAGRAARRWRWHPIPLIKPPLLVNAEELDLLLAPPGGIVARPKKTD